MTLEEAFYLCDSMIESFDLPPLSLAFRLRGKVSRGKSMGALWRDGSHKLLRSRGQPLMWTYWSRTAARPFPCSCGGTSFFRSKAAQLKHRRADRLICWIPSRVLADAKAGSTACAGYRNRATRLWRRHADGHAGRLDCHENSAAQTRARRGQTKIKLISSTFYSSTVIRTFRGSALRGQCKRNMIG